MVGPVPPFCKTLVTEACVVAVSVIETSNAVVVTVVSVSVSVMSVVIERLLSGVTACPRLRQARSVSWRSPALSLTQSREVVDDGWDEDEGRGNGVKVV